MHILKLGCSGWSYDEWVGPLYKSKDERKLMAYSRVFPVAEIDSTFYAYPGKGMVIGWSRYSGPDFTFTAKLPKVVTHDKRLALDQGVENDVKRFCELMSPLQLQGKLACLLIQLPPGFSYNLEVLESFFKVLPGDYRFAVEFRDLSWMRDETWKLLTDYRVAYTIVDEPLLPPEAKVTTDFAYFRWHGRGRRPWYNYLYKAEELEPWIPRIQDASTKTKTVYGFFNNHYHGYAVENCLQVLEMLGALTPRQAEAKRRAEEYLRNRKRVMEGERGTPKLTGFMPKAQRGSAMDLLSSFMDRPRLMRAEDIDDGEVAVYEASEERVRASIRDYQVLIDLKGKAVYHDCADWSRCIPLKEFCKHVGKIFLILPEERAVSILTVIGREKQVWEFKPYTR